MTPEEQQLNKAEVICKTGKRVPSRNYDNYVKQRKQRQKEITAL